MEIEEGEGGRETYAHACMHAHVHVHTHSHAHVCDNMKLYVDSAVQSVCTEVFISTVVN